MLHHLSPQLSSFQSSNNSKLPHFNSFSKYPKSKFSKTLSTFSRLLREESMLGFRFLHFQSQIFSIKSHQGMRILICGVLLSTKFNHSSPLSNFKLGRLIKILWALVYVSITEKFILSYLLTLFCIKMLCQAMIYVRVSWYPN